VPHLLETDANLAVVSSYDLCENGLECQEFFTDFISLIVPVEHPWAKRPFVEPAELVQEPMIIREPTSGTRRVMLTELAKHDITLDDLNVFLEVGNAEAIVSTIQAGYGIAFVSKLAAIWACKQKQVVAVPVADLQLRRKIYMMRRSLDALGGPQEVFWGFIHSEQNADLFRMTQQS
jgi:DNA-binding transcriptional LysR family regulator